MLAPKEKGSCSFICNSEKCDAAGTGVMATQLRMYHQSIRAAVMYEKSIGHTEGGEVMLDMKEETEIGFITLIHAQHQLNI